jgi:hypothetical protein
LQTTVHHTSKRAWGFETLLTITADDGSIWGECIVTDMQPKDYSVVIQEATNNVLNRLSIIAESKVVEESKTAIESDIATLEATKVSLIKEIEVLESTKKALEEEKVITK